MYFRRNSSSASDSAYSNTFLRIVVCRLSVVCHTRASCLKRSTDLDAILQEHSWAPMTQAEAKICGWNPAANRKEAIPATAKLLQCLFHSHSYTILFCVAAVCFSCNCVLHSDLTTIANLQWKNIVDQPSANRTFWHHLSHRVDQGSDTHQERTRQVDEPRRGVLYQLPHMYVSNVLYCIAGVHARCDDRHSWCRTLPLCRPGRQQQSTFVGLCCRRQPTTRRRILWL